MGKAAVRLKNFTELKTVKVTPESPGPWLRAMLARGQTERFTVEALMTSELARLLLERNEGNRRIAKTKVASLAHTMKLGKFNALNGETIQISKCGHLNNGQHRLHAVLDSGVEQPFTLMFGLDREARLTVDQARGRTVADFLAMRDLPDGYLVSAVALMLYQWRNFRKVSTDAGYRISMSDLADYAEANYDQISQSVRIVPRAGAGLVGGVPVLAFAHAIFGEIDMEMATDYITRLVQGHELERGSPLLAVRNRFLRRDLTRRADRFELLVRGWNTMREGKQAASFTVARYGIPQPI